MRIAILLLVAAFAGCIGESDSTDSTDDGGAPEPRLYAGSHPAYNFAVADSINASWTPQWAPPVHPGLPETLTGLELLADGPMTTGAAGIAVFGHWVYAGPVGGPLSIVDIADPANPVLASTLDVPVRDADVIAFPSGQLILVTATGGASFYVVDVTNATAPVELAAVDTVYTNHNIAVVPGTPIVYNSASGSAATDIYDLSDPANPELVNDFANGNACHDITFYVNETVQRAYCAGRAETEIWDISDPTNPDVLVRIPFPTGGYSGPQAPGGASPASFSHLATVNHDASVLIVGDETGGGAAPACDFYVDAMGTTVSGPLGNLWFYDVSDELNPVLHGHMSPPPTEMSGSCTAHFGEVIEDRDQLVMAFYSAGVVLVDFSDLDNPRMVNNWKAGSLWDAQVYQGRVYTGDTSNGVDVLEFI